MWGRKHLREAGLPAPDHHPHECGPTRAENSFTSIALQGTHRNLWVKGSGPPFVDDENETSLSVSDTCVILSIIRSSTVAKRQDPSDESGDTFWSFFPLFGGSLT